MREMIEEMVDEMLDADGDIRIGGVYFVRSRILKEMDPIAYRELVLDYVNSHLEELRDELECLDPESDADEVEFLKDRIEELENI